METTLLVFVYFLFFGGAVKLIRIVFVVTFLLCMVGCSKVQVAPRLDSSLGYDAFSKMKCIEVKDAAIALYLDPELLSAKTHQSIKMGEFTFEIGKTLAVKLVKGLAYQFRTIYLVDKPTLPSGMKAQALMRVTLQDIDTQMNVKTGFNTVTAESYTRLSVRAEIKDMCTQKIVWVGTSQVSQTGGVNERMLTYAEAGRGFASGFDSAIDKAIGDLFYQMGRSQSLNNYFKLLKKGGQDEEG